MKNINFWVVPSNSTPTFNSCMPLGKLLHLSKSWFPHLLKKKKRCKNTTLIGWFWKLNEMIMQIIQHPVWHTVCAVLGHISCAQLFVTLWTIAHQVPQSMGFSRQEYWSWLPFPTPGELPDPRIESTSLISPVLAGITASGTWETLAHGQPSTNARHLYHYFIFLFNYSSKM